MAEVSLAIHGKSYGIACDDGQEARVRELGKYIDARMREIASAGAATNEPHLLVLTALVLADEVYDLRGALQSQMAAQHQQEMAHAAQMDSEEERQVVDAINHLAARIESVAARLQKI
ncbi:cell division protein ZapA [Micavibrio aeruginosavorus]|uniref:cell division protein ZapA n=1 Tax=Micavibrio aeruginosavorus TaxID=349221 RepID=UPI003F4AE630